MSDVAAPTQNLYVPELPDDRSMVDFQIQITCWHPDCQKKPPRPADLDESEPDPPNMPMFIMMFDPDSARKVLDAHDHPVTSAIQVWRSSL